MCGVVERLTTHWMDGTYDTFNPIDIADNDYSKINYEKLLAKLGEYEDAEEQGSLYRTHGLWIKINDGFYFDFKCSVCGNLNEFARNYCPNCGAKMDLNQILKEGAE